MSGVNQVVISTCHGAEVSSYYHDCLVRLMVSDGDTHRHIAAYDSMQTGPIMSVARASLAKRFMVDFKPVPWLLFLDTDMVFMPSLVHDLLSVAHPTKFPVVGGLCFTADRHGGQVYPTIYVKNERGGYGPVADFPDNDLVRCDATGAACLLIHRSVFAKTDDGSALPWFGEQLVDGQHFTEDTAFCRRLADADIPVHVHTGIRLGHVKPRVVEAADFFAAK